MVDHHANPSGTWQTHQAASEAYRFLGNEERIGIVLNSTAGIPACDSLSQAGSLRYSKHRRSNIFPDIQTAKTPRLKCCTRIFAIFNRKYQFKN
ncbi:MAG: hypothetical protein WCI51_07495 [Lentisphaerota bacterium]